MTNTLGHSPPDFGRHCMVIETLCSFQHLTKGQTFCPFISGLRIEMWSQWTLNIIIVVGIVALWNQPLHGHHFNRMWKTVGLNRMLNLGLVFEQIVHCIYIIAGFAIFLLHILHMQSRISSTLHTFSHFSSSIVFELDSGNLFTLILAYKNMTFMGNATLLLLVFK